MRRFSSAAVATLLAERERLKRDNQALSQRLDQLQHPLEWFKRQLFGEKSEGRPIEPNPINSLWTNRWHPRRLMRKWNGLWPRTRVGGERRRHDSRELGVALFNRCNPKIVTAAYSAWHREPDFCRCCNTIQACITEIASPLSSRDLSAIRPLSTGYSVEYYRP